MSPDGRYLAYMSFETGEWQVFITRYPSGQSKWQVSTGGGARPLWRADGKELFFFSSSGGGQLMATDIHESGSSLQFSTPRELFAVGMLNLGHALPYQAPAISADGRFLVPLATSTVSNPVENPITVTLNWAAALRK